MVRATAAVAVAVLLGGASPVPAQENAAGRTLARADAYYQFVLGRHFESEGEIDRAVEAYRKAARLDPESAEIRAELAGLYTRQGRLDDALTEARAALEIDGRNHEAHRVLGSILAEGVEQSASESDRAEHLGAAIRHLEQGRSPDGAVDPALEVTLARLYIRNDDPEKAIALLRALLEEQSIADAWLTLAQAYTAAGRSAEALAALEDGSNTSPALLLGLADMYERQEQWDRAAATYERAAAQGSPSPDLRIRWAGALLNGSGEGSARRARELLDAALAEQPDDERALYMLAQAHRKLRSFDAAEAAARKAMALRPDSLWGLYALAQVFEDRREYRRLVDLLTPALAEWKPSRASPAPHGLTLLTHLGFAQLQLGLYDQAIATFERARALASDGSSFDIYLAQALSAARRFDDALRILEPLRARQAGDYRIAQLTARALSGVGRSDEAVGLMRDVVRAKPGEPAPYLALADLLAETQRFDDAHEVLDAASQRFANDPSILFQRGALYERAGDATRAEAAFRQVLEHEPSHAPALNYLGYMFAERGVRLQEALALIERALAVDPDNGSYLDSLGWAYYQLKRFDVATDYLSRAAEQLPANSVVQDHLGDALAAMGRREEAVAAWTRALQGDRESVQVAAIEGKIRRAQSQAER